MLGLTIDELQAAMRDLANDELKAVSGGCDSLTLCPCNTKITHGPQPKPSPAKH